MEVTAFIIELSAEVVKGIQGGNEYRIRNNEKLRVVRFWKGLVQGERFGVAIPQSCDR